MTGVRILVVGEALVDVVESGDGSAEEHVGGSPANVAFGLAALGHDVELATWIGRDERGDRVAHRCAQAGVRLTAGSRGADQTSVAHATLDRQGRASYRFDLTWSLPALAGRPDHVHTGSLATVLEPGGGQVVHEVRSLRAHSTVSYDPNVRPTVSPSPARVRTRVEELVSLADVVKASDEDVQWLYPGTTVADVLRRWEQLGPPLRVITRGAQGAAYAVSSAEVRTMPAPRGHVVDTVGAGDSFMAGLLSGLVDAGYLGGAAARERLRAAAPEDARAAVERALRAAGATVAHAGAYAPRRAELGADTGATSSSPPASTSPSG